MGQGVIISRTKISIELINWWGELAKVVFYPERQTRVILAFDLNSKRDYLLGVVFPTLGFKEKSISSGLAKLWKQQVGSFWLLK